MAGLFLKDPQEIYIDGVLGQYCIEVASFYVVLDENSMSPSSVVPD
jgi:hypothetical protein